jgi:hypothetical protein
MWLCRTFQSTSTFRFLGTVLKVLFEPFPHLFVEVPRTVEQRKIRNRTRATVLLSAAIETPASAQHPRVAFYGIRFGSLSELDACVLNGFVNSELALELNSLWQVLSMSSPGARD